MEQALADYLDALPRAERRALAGPHGGGHHGGGGHGGHWGGGPMVYGNGWGGAWAPAYTEPVYVVERQAAAPAQYIGVKPPRTVRCAQQPIGDGLWRCASGAIVYDVTKYELRSNGLVARGFNGLGVTFVPQAQRTAPIAPVRPRMQAVVRPTQMIAPSAPVMQRYFSPGTFTPGTLAPASSTAPSTAPDQTAMPDGSTPSGGGITSKSATPNQAPSEQQPVSCPPGAAFDITVNTCVCGAGLEPSADGSACVPAGSSSAGGGSSSAFGWFALLVGAAIMARAVG